MRFASYLSMPIHDYECPTCGHHLTELTPQTDLTQPHCSTCGAQMTRKTSVSSFVIKGYSAKSGYTRKEA